MADNGIVKRSLLEESAIDRDAFTASLLEQASALGLLTQAEADKIQEGLLLLLSRQIHYLTRGDSSSIPAAAAERLMDGIGYCVDVCLKAQPSLDASLALLKSTPTEELYQHGRTLLETHAKAGEALLSRVRATRTRTVNAGYRITLDDSLPGMLRGWKTVPYPQSFTLLTEYPLAREITADGIEGLHAYLAALALENRFCARFIGALDGLLEDFSRQNRVSPEDAYVNLFSLALRNLLLARLLRKGGAELTREELAALEARLRPLSAAGREQLFLHTAELLTQECAFESPKLDAYILEEASRFSHAVNLAGGALGTLAVVREADNRLIHVDGERLDDDAFAAVAEELLLCENAARKAQLIREELRSLGDLCDMLDAGCVFEEELPEVFAGFDDGTCALLLTCCPVETAGRQIALGDGSTAWQEALADDLNSGDAQRRGRILGLYRAFEHA